MTPDAYAAARTCPACQSAHSSHACETVCRIAGALFNGLFAVLSAAVGRRR